MTDGGSEVGGGREGGREGRDRVMGDQRAREGELRWREAERRRQGRGGERRI